MPRHLIVKIMKDKKKILKAEKYTLHVTNPTIHWVYELEYIGIMYVLVYAIAFPGKENHLPYIREYQ